MEILEILKYILPSVIVFATAYFVTNSFLDRDERKRRMEFTINNQRLITPIKLQAYERIVLFLERISPEQLIVRVQSPVLTVKEFQSALLATIRTEFEHNLSQQIYVSANAWESVKSAKESIVKLINAASTRVSSDMPAMELSKTIIDMYLSVENSPTAAAINIIKDEIHEVFEK